jgi:predicted ribosome quality control (RQC) complex YloA/Tae2 family protein
MPFDGIVTKNIVNELSSLLVNTRIDKVQMPERDEIVLLVRTSNGNMRLSISANPGCPGIYINKIKKRIH